MDCNEMWRRLLESADPIDLAAGYLPTLESYYRGLYAIAAELAPRSIVEIGVRAGYSAFAMLCACPHARAGLKDLACRVTYYLGIEADWDEARGENTHGGRHGAWRHAERLLAPFDAQILLAASHNIRRLPAADLIYVDGDHSLTGCAADLDLAGESMPRCILVDDYDNIPEVRTACDAFAAARAASWTARPIPNGSTGFFLLERRKS